MAHIHRISGSTQYLINGTRPIQGKKLATLDEIQHFYDHYSEILTETQTTISRQQDKIILGLSDDELRLDRQLQDAIARQTQEVDKNIDDLNLMITLEKRFFTRTGYRLRHWIAVTFRDQHIHAPYAGISRELGSVRDRKNNHINNKQTVIQRECYNITSSYEFLRTNETFLIGAHGEEAVIAALSRLPDEFHVLNDVNLHFQKAIHWRERNEYIKNCQIDHIVVRPTGIFLVETKNWKSSDIELKSDDLRYQVRRSSLALWYYLKKFYWRAEWPKIRNVIVSMNGSPSGRKPDKYIDIVTPNQLCSYITARKIALSEAAIHRLVDLLSRERHLRPRF